MAPLEHDIYGIDIETEVRGGTLDPSVSRIRAIAVSTRSSETTFTGDEVTILNAVDHHLASLPDGVVATWNGAVFDLPFIADRARALGVGLGLVLCPDHRRRVGCDLLPGHEVAYRATWGRHRHLDTFRLYGDSGSSSTLGSLIGLPRRRAATIASTGNLLNEALHAHAASDARLARVLAERRRQSALRLVDHIAEDEDAVRLDLAGRVRDALGDRAESVRVRPAIAGIS
jgi:hypothetical protein